MFGVGAKMSAFFIGEDLTMVTKSADSDQVKIFEFHFTLINATFRSLNIIATAQKLSMHIEIGYYISMTWISG